MRIEAHSPIKSIEVEAVIIRADGRIEPVGTIAYWHRNPTMRFLFWLKRTFFRG